MAVPMLQSDNALAGPVPLAMAICASCVAGVSSTQHSIIHSRLVTHGPITAHGRRVYAAQRYKRARNCRLRTTEVALSFHIRRKPITPTKWVLDVDAEERYAVSHTVPVAVHTRETERGKERKKKISSTSNTSVCRGPSIHSLVPTVQAQNSKSRWSLSALANFCSRHGFTTA
jgi:hypothetical protein